jgi:hypothetical protein
MYCCIHNNIDHGASVQISCYVIYIKINLIPLVIYVISYQYNILNFYCIANSKFIAHNTAPLLILASC